MYQSVIALLQSKRYKEAEREAVRLVRRFPLEAQPWVYLGEALLHQGCGQTADQIFYRALLLDPHAAWPAAVREALGKAPSGARRPGMEQLLQVKRVTVSAGIIAKNEIRCIERCLNSIVAAVDEIVVVDNGSTDGTAEFAASFPKVKVVHAEWSDDFSALRNAGLPYFTADWVIWLDADEVLLQEDSGHIRMLAGLFDEAPKPSLLYAGTMETKEGQIGQPAYDKARMFPLRHGIHYKGRVHEQIVPESGSVFGDDFIRKPVLIRFIHDGYETAVIQEKNKQERNLRLLEIMMKEEPENPTWLWFFGRETLVAGDRETAERCLLQAEAKAMAEPRFGRKTDIRMLLTHIYLMRDELEKAEAVCRRILEEVPNYPDAVYVLAQTEMRQAYAKLQQAESHLHESKMACVSYRGATPADLAIAGWKADLSIAEIAANSGHLAVAKEICGQILKGFPDQKETGLLLDRINKIR